MVVNHKIPFIQLSMADVSLYVLKNEYMLLASGAIVTSNNYLKKKLN